MTLTVIQFNHSEDQQWHWKTGPLPELPAAEEQLVCVDGDEVLARCGFWWQQVPELDGEKIGVIGQYAAETADAGEALLLAACDRLRHQGRCRVIGPMDGSTWHSHRWVTWSDGEPSFPLEPQQPARWVDDWRAAGFVPLAGYHSSLASPESVDEAAMNARLQVLEERGIRIRPIDDSRFVEELQAIHALSLQSFSDNFLYQPLTQKEFVALYSPFAGRYDPRASALAERSLDGKNRSWRVLCLPTRRRRPMPTADRAWY